MADSAKLISSSAPSVFKNLLASTTAGLNAKKDPEPTKQGAGGSYFMHDASGKRVSVFKPLDEEPNYAGEGIKEVSLERAVSVTAEGLRKGTKAGKGAVREAAAYILDHPKSCPRSVTCETNGFAGVPPTTYGSCRHAAFKRPEGSPVTAKLGSLQMYMENKGDCSDYGPTYFDIFPLDEVHKIAVLDMRLANTDRHGGNILITESEDVLIPIDHGYCLPESFEDIRFDWLEWPQAKKPFTPATIKYIEMLDAEEDIDLLKSYGWDMPQKTARVFRISTMLLKEGAKRGLTPYEIGDIMCRDNPDKGAVKEKSVIEQIVEEALNLSEEDNDKFLEVVSVVMDRRLGEIAIA